MTVSPRGLPAVACAKQQPCGSYFLHNKARFNLIITMLINRNISDLTLTYYKYFSHSAIKIVAFTLQWNRFSWRDLYGNKTEIL
jgi:hypothetical protein